MGCSGPTGVSARCTKASYRSSGGKFVPVLSEAGPYLFLPASHLHSGQSLWKKPAVAGGPLGGTGACGPHGSFPRGLDCRPTRSSCGASPGVRSTSMLDRRLSLSHLHAKANQSNPSSPRRDLAQVAADVANQLPSLGCYSVPNSPR
jgi:hypothetical protein